MSCNTARSWKQNINIHSTSHAIYYAWLSILPNIIFFVVLTCVIISCNPFSPIIKSWISKSIGPPIIVRINTSLIAGIFYNIAKNFSHIPILLSSHFNLRFVLYIVINRHCRFSSGFFNHSKNVFCLTSSHIF